MNKLTSKKGVVRLHPLPEGADPQLAQFVGQAVDGALKSFLSAHPMVLSNQERGLLLGSARKRIVNQLCCEQSVEKLKELLK